MKKVNTGIIVINQKIPLVIGDKVVLKRDLNNNYDKSSIKCFKEGEFIGYVSSDEYMLPKNCVVNRKVIPYFRFIDEIQGKVITSDTILCRKDNGRTENSYIVEIYVPDIEVMERKKRKKLKVLIGGTLKKYPHRDEIKKQIENGKNQIEGIIDLEKGEIFVKENPIGEFKKLTYKGNDLTDYKYLLTDDNVVYIKSKHGRYLLGEIEISKEIEENIKKEHIEGLIQEIVKKRIDTKENIQEKLSYIQENNICISVFTNILNTYIKYKKEDKPYIKRPEFLYKDGQGIMKRTLHYLTLRNKNVTLVGERGSGKSTMAETIAWIFNRPVITISFSRDTDKYDIWGYKTIDITEKGEKKVIFVDGPLTKAIKNGYIVIFDEINVADPGVLESMNSILDHRREVYVPELGQIKAHENFMAITTENYDNYQGVNKLNEAFRDRFIRIRCVADESIKELLMRKNPILKSEVLDILDDIYKGIRSLTKEGEISEKSLTIRGFENVALSYDPEVVSLKEVLIDCIVNQADNEDDREHIMNIINMEVL